MGLTESKEELTLFNLAWRGIPELSDEKAGEILRDTQNIRDIRVYVDSEQARRDKLHPLIVRLDLGIKLISPGLIFDFHLSNYANTEQNPFILQHAKVFEDLGENLGENKRRKVVIEYGVTTLFRLKSLFLSEVMAYHGLLYRFDIGIEDLLISVQDKLSFLTHSRKIKQFLKESTKDKIGTYTYVFETKSSNINYHLYLNEKTFLCDERMQLTLEYYKQLCGGKIIDVSFSMSDNRITDYDDLHEQQAANYKLDPEILDFVEYIHENPQIDWDQFLSQFNDHPYVRHQKK